MQLKVGCDPEFFVKGSEHFISAHDIVPGSKQKPHKLKCKGAVQADGTAIEFNIEPAINPREFKENIEATLREIRKMVPAELKFEFTPAALYPVSYFDTLPEFSKELGCDPDYDAYNGRANPRPNNSTLVNGHVLRTGAGHIHLGWGTNLEVEDPSHLWDCRNITQLLDAYFGYFYRLWDTDQLRSSMYGARGAFRPKSYGVEYRVLSNAWLKYPKLWPWIFESSEYVVRYAKTINEQTYNDSRWFRIPKDNIGYAEYRAWHIFGDGVPTFPRDFQTEVYSG